MPCPHQHQHQHHQQQPRHLARVSSAASCKRNNRSSNVIRASEYRNLRQVVPSLRRQRDLGKVEVVTEAAKYIDYLHKTLIKRFVACGIPESLKGKSRLWFAFNRLRSCFLFSSEFSSARETMRASARRQDRAASYRFSRAARATSGSEQSFRRLPRFSLLFTAGPRQPYLKRPYLEPP